MAVVSLDGLSKRYGSRGPVAVDQVSLTVADGEFMVLLGPSGCGKTTTLRMVAGLETISGGMLSIDGRVVNGLPARERDIAMVFQSYALYPHMTVRENLGFGLRRRRVPLNEIARSVSEVAAALKLSDYLDRKPQALSGGQRQRVALGRAIVRDPKVFLFDEPLSNLDAGLRASTRSEIARLHRRLGATMIYVTHDQVEAMTLGDRICVMQNGRIAQVGAPLDVYSRPANTFVARFLGAPPMNILRATTRQGEADVSVTLGGPGRARAAAYREAPGVALAGVRAEHLRPAAPETAWACGVVQSVERLGAETVLGVLLTHGEEVAVRLPSDFAIALGETIGLEPEPGTLHLFDPQTGAALPRHHH